MTCRAIVWAIALYALLLQAFLAAATPSPPLSETGIICLDHQDGSPNNDTPATHTHHCCTVAHHPGLAPLTVAASVVPLAVPQVTIVSWRLEPTALKTGPPDYAQSARGPPQA